MAGKKGNPKKGGPKKGMGYIFMFLLAFIILPALANRSEAGGLSWSDKPFYWTMDHTSLDSEVTDINQRGLSQKALYGSLGTLTLGVNQFETGLLSLGIGAQSGDPSVPGSPTVFTGSLGFVPICGPNRNICLDVNLSRSAHETTRMLSAVFRFQTLTGL